MDFELFPFPVTKLVHIGGYRAFIPFGHLICNSGTFSITVLCADLQYHLPLGCVHVCVYWLSKAFTCSWNLFLVEISFFFSFQLKINK